MSTVAFSGMAEAIENRRRPVSKPMYLKADSPILAAAMKVSQAREDRYLADSRRTVSSCNMSLSPASRSSGSSSVFELTHSPATTDCSSLASSPPTTPPMASEVTDNKKQRSKSASFLFPVPPSPAQLTKSKLALDATGFGNGLGLDDFLPQNVEERPQLPPTTLDLSPISLNVSAPMGHTLSLQSNGTSYDLDELLGSQGWSPSTAGDRSVCASPALDQSFSMSFTRPLSIRKPSGTVPLASADDEDEAKLERLHSSLSLLAIGDLCDDIEEQQEGQENGTDHDEASEPSLSPASPEDLRYMYSPEHGAPSLEEQLAYACGQGYMRDGGVDSIHHDSASGYLQWLALAKNAALSVDGHSPAPSSSISSSMDPFTGMRGEMGASWSEVHSGLSRGNSLRATPAMYSPLASRRQQPVSMASPQQLAAVASRMHKSFSATSFAEPRAAPVPQIQSKTFARPSPSFGRESPLGIIAKTRSQLDLVGLFRQEARKASESPSEPSADTHDSPSAIQLEEFSFMTMLDETDVDVEEAAESSTYRVVLPEPRIRLLSPDVFTCPLGSPDVEGNCAASLASRPKAENASPTEAVKSSQLLDNVMQASLQFQSSSSQSGLSMPVSQSMPALSSLCNFGAGVATQTTPDYLGDAAPLSMMDRARPVRRGSKYHRQVTAATIKTRRTVRTEKELPSLPSVQELTYSVKPIPPMREGSMAGKMIVTTKSSEGANTAGQESPAEALKNAWRKNRDLYASDKSRTVPPSLVPAHEGAMKRSMSAFELQEHTMLRSSPTRSHFAVGKDVASQSCSNLSNLAANGNAKGTSLSREASQAMREAKAQSLKFKQTQHASKPSNGGASQKRPAACAMTKSVSMPSKLSGSISSSESPATAAYPLPTLMVARTNSQRRRGETGLAETHPRLLEAIREQEMEGCDNEYDVDALPHSSWSTSSASDKSVKKATAKSGSQETRFAKARWSSVKSLVMPSSMSKKARAAAALAARSEVVSRSSMDSGSRSSMSLSLGGQEGRDGLWPVGEVCEAEEEEGVLVLEEKSVSIHSS